MIVFKNMQWHANLNVSFLSPKDGPIIGYTSIKSCLFTLPNGFNDLELSIQYMRQSLRKHPLACKP